MVSKDYKVTKVRRDIKDFKDRRDNDTQSVNCGCKGSKLFWKYQICKAYFVKF